MSSSDSDVEFIESRKPAIPRDNTILCKVCLSMKVEQIVLPCGHACLCTSCLYQLPIPKVCPVCRCHISDAVDVKIV